MSKIKDKVIDEIILNQTEIEVEDDELIDPSHRVEEIEETNIDTLEFWDEIDTSETTKAKLKRLYNNMARKKWYQDIEDFYVTKKFELATKTNFSKSDDYMSNLLKTIAMDLWYWSSNKEIVMHNNLPSVSWNDLIGR